ncbi:pyridoxal phosphate-dependent decarboxylase family protein [Cellulomonas sp. McL0617]|uniref:pyridoxal phosphate-dependent decarboxylase family protein n=1 Tax=Cellulomonas sp. McL0617 TaxID=3415675 RepID=UPI003CE9D08C
MTARWPQFEPALGRATEHTREWLEALHDRPVHPKSRELAFGGPLPDGPTDPALVVDELAAGIEPGLMSMPSGRFFGWVIGGSHPAALAADWLTAAWDQNSAMRYATPGTVAVEDAAGAWLLDLLGLPTTADVGFVTGATMANFTGLAAARQQVLADAGWDVNRDGLSGAPRVRVLVGEERHGTLDLALRYLGLGVPQAVAADAQGRLVVDDLARALGDGSGPTIVCLQAGNLHSGAFDPIADAVEVAHAHGAWVHVDGAFGLWAAASPRLRDLVRGLEGADSWATDAHKTLNVPYDCGVAIVARPESLRRAFGMQAEYFAAFADEGDPQEKVPELSRRARGVPVWAALRSLGRSGVADLVDRLALRARQIADGLAGIEGAEILNDVVFTQVSVAFGSDERTRRVGEALIADGGTWMSGSHWQGRDILRVSVSNWSTDEEDVARSIEAVRRAVSAAG